jgi:hypothetical protein
MTKTTYSFRDFTMVQPLAARLAAVERRLQLVNAKHARPARRKPGAKPLLELVK